MRKIYFLALTIAVFISVWDSAQAQMLGSNVFLKGRYLELGIGQLGYYGSDSSAPAGYHPHLTGSSRLGFVADPAMDGWTIGTPPMMGDYFLPGSPFEGWEIQINGKRCQAFNYSGGTAFAVSDTTLIVSSGASAYSISGSKVTSVFQVTIDSIVLTQATTLDTNDLYFTVKVTLFNLAWTPKNNIYYLRTLDPDNDASWLSSGGAFYTTNKIDHQSTDTTVVSATGQVATGSPYLGLGTTDVAATCLVYRNWPLSLTTDISTMYNMTYYDSLTQYIQGSSATLDHALGLVFSIPHLATVDSMGDSVFRTTADPGLHPANTASFTFFYSFAKAATDSAIVRSLDGVTTSTPAIKNIDGSISLYPNPSKETINITNLNTTDRISLYDMMGRDVRQGWQVTSEGTNTFRYDNIPAGAYVVIVADKAGNIRARVPIRKQ